MSVILSTSDLRKPLGLDRAFDQSSPTHDVDFGIRRRRYGRFLDAGCAASITTWSHAGIPTAIYAFMRSRRAGEDPIQQAELLVGDRAALKVNAVMVDWERDVSYHPDGSVRYDYGIPPEDELQALVDHLDAAGVPVFGYWSEGVAPGRPIRHLRGVLLANIAHRVTRDVSAGCQVLGQQYSWKPWDQSIWDDAPSFTELFVRPYAPVPVSDHVAPAPKESEVADNLVPLTVHRVVDLPIGTIFRAAPSVTSGRYGSVTVDDAHPDAPTRAFGLLGAPQGTADWYRVADGDRGVFVRRTDVAAIRTADLNVGA